MKSFAWCTLVPTLALAVSCGGANTPAASPAAATLPGPAPAEPAASGPASFRDKAPAPGALAAPVFPKPEIRQLPNGIKLVTYEMHDLPVVRMTMFRKGTRSPVDTLRWRFAERMTAKHSVTELASLWQSMGAEHGAFIGDDAAGLSAKVMSKDAMAALDLLAEEWLQPGRDVKEFERLKAELIDGVRNERSDLKSVARNLTRVSLADYNRQLHGDEKGFAATTLVQLAHESEISGGDSFQGTACPTHIVLVGDLIGSQIAERIGRFDCPKRSDQLAVFGMSKSGQAEWRVNVRKAATQVHLYLVHPGVVSASSVKRPAFWIMSEILGGSFASRINMNLREKNAFTYGAYARYRPFVHEGMLSIGGPMKADKAGDAYEQIRAELTRMQTELVTDDELRRAKDAWLRTLSARYETADDIVGAWLSDSVLGGPLGPGQTFADDAANFTKAVEAVTKEQVLAMAKEYLDIAKMDLVTVGDGDVIKSEFAPFKLGEPKLYDELGVPLDTKSDKAASAAAKPAKPVKASKPSK